MEGKYGEIDGDWPHDEAEGSGKKMVDDPFLRRREEMGGKRWEGRDGREEMGGKRKRSKKDGRGEREEGRRKEKKEGESKTD